MRLLIIEDNIELCKYMRDGLSQCLLIPYHRMYQGLRQSVYRKKFYLLAYLKICIGQPICKTSY